MLTNHPYPYQPLSPEEMQALIRRAHAERAKAIRDAFQALFRRKPVARKASDDAALAAAGCN